MVRLHFPNVMKIYQQHLQVLDSWNSDFIKLLAGLAGLTGWTSMVWAFKEQAGSGTVTNVAACACSS